MTKHMEVKLKLSILREIAELKLELSCEMVKKREMTDDVGEVKWRNSSMSQVKELRGMIQLARSVKVGESSMFAIGC